jgi:hypothetical protein
VKVKADTFTAQTVRFGTDGTTLIVAAGEIIGLFAAMLIASLDSIPAQADDVSGPGASEVLHANLRDSRPQ